MHTSTLFAAPVDSSAPAAPQYVPGPSLAELRGETTENPAATKPVSEDPLADRLAQARLGVASGLFHALKCKHAATASHSLRVSIGCSAWAQAIHLAELEREQLEVAALFHDIGKIGVPDQILLKPDALTRDEEEVMHRHRLAGLDILQSCCPSAEVLDIIKHCNKWFDGRKAGQLLKGRAIPLGARMLAIVDAFDSMTSDQVYRPAMSRERALTELFAGAGTQFDPDLVMLFNKLHEEQQFNPQVSGRWLHQLDPQTVNSLWRISTTPAPATQLAPESLFFQKLLDSMRDGVVFVDHTLQIMMWNHGAERLTGVSAGAVQQRRWTSRMIHLCDSMERPLSENDCPVKFALETGTQALRRLTILRATGEVTPVDVQTMPVVRADGVTQGVAILIHDATPQASLELQCQSLHERATRDQLTQVANRAEFDRTLKLFVATHLQKKAPCALVMSDIDHFKSINDTFGHPAGDEALKSVASVLKSFCRTGDLVARYGGEEFAMLCANCNNATAAQRADEIRRAIHEMPQMALNGKHISASFGVTEIQAGDDPTLMLNRADRALYEAKQRGRNLVVQLGSGIAAEPEKPRHWFARLLRNPVGDLAIQQWLIATVPLAISVEKLRGFIVDHKAKLEAIDGERVCMIIDNQQMNEKGARPMRFRVEVKMTEERAKAEGGPAGGMSTRIHVDVRPNRHRDRRRNDIAQQSRKIINSIKAYLMATEVTAPTTPALQKATNLLMPWSK